ncbi:hypothetical protein, partial [Burkholderia cenocepacia]
ETLFDFNRNPCSASPKYAGNPEYEARKAAKIKSYKSRGVQVIEWDTRRPMPALHRATCGAGKRVE